MSANSNFSVQRRPELILLSNDQRYRIHMAALDVLERTGVRFLEPEAVELLRGAGADITDQTLVRIPSSLVEEALRSAPKRIVIYNRNGEPALFLEGHNVYFGTGSDLPNTIDPFSGRRRQSKKQDIGDAALLCDYLSNIDFVMSMGIASDVDSVTADRHHFEQMISNTTKPIIFTASNLDGLADIYEMCIAVAGDAESFRRTPFAIHYAEPTTPLRHTVEATQQLLFCAEKGIPLVYVSGPSMGASAPVTIAGAVVLSMAEFLSGLVVSQLKRKGASIICGGGGSPMDMRTTTFSYAAPENWLDEIAVREMATYYGLPVFGEGGVSDAKLFDQQAALEVAITLMLVGLSGTNLIHDVGYLESGVTACYEAIILSNEVIGEIKRFLKGVKVTEETLAVDVINRVGPGGNFLIDKHTVKLFKEEVWYPEYLDRQNYDGWLKSGGKSLGETLNARAKWILENHQPEPLEPSIRQTIREIVERSGAGGRSVKRGPNPKWSRR